MKLISIHEDPERVDAIDRLVSEGTFGSRAEAYRTGALLMITVKEARRLAKLDQLEPALFGNNVKNLLKSLDRENLEGAKNHLDRINDALQLRSVLSTLLGEEDLREHIPPREGRCRLHRRRCFPSLQSLRDAHENGGGRRARQ